MAKTTKQKKRQAELLVVAGLILGELIFCAILANGIMKGGQKEKVTALREKVISGQGVLSREIKIKSHFSTGYADLEELADFVPKAADPYAWAYEYISERATHAGISLKEIKEVDSKKENGEQENIVYKVSIKMNCSYLETIEFLTQLEDDNPLLLVAQLEINADEMNPTDHLTTMLLQWPLDFVIETEK